MIAYFGFGVSGLVKRCLYILLSTLYAVQKARFKQLTDGVLVKARVISFIQIIVYSTALVDVSLNSIYFQISIYTWQHTSMIDTNTWKMEWKTSYLKLI